MKGFAGGITEDIFQGLELERERKSNPRTDILRALKISDSNSVDKNCLCLEEVKILSEDTKGWHFSKQRHKHQKTQYDI